MKKSLVIICAALLLFGSVQLVQAYEFVDNFDLFGNYTQYLYSTTNAQVLHEHWGGGWHVDYWAPIVNYQWAEIVYKYDLPFDISSARINGVFAMFNGNDPKAKGYFDVSSDGLNWTNVQSGTVQPYWLVPPIDISDILYGSTTAYIRARLYQELAVGRTAQAQFLRTDIRYSEYQAPYIYEFRAASAPVPEPATMILLGSGLVGLAGVRNKLRRLQNAPLV